MFGCLAKSNYSQSTKTNNGGRMCLENRIVTRQVHMEILAHVFSDAEKG
jgi:hypothetical protein